MLNLYKIPGSFVFGFMGAFGTGKTLGLLEQGVKMAHVYGLRIVANFPINQKLLNEYCRLKKYKYIRAITFDTSNDLDAIINLLIQERSVILLDEAGIELFSRGFKDSNRQEIFKELFQVRKARSFIFYSCQYIDQVDKQLRDNTHIWLLCQGHQSFCSRRKFSILHSRFIVAFDKVQFQTYMSKPEKQSKKIYPLHLSGWRFAYSHLFLSKVLGFFRHVRLGFKFSISSLRVHKIKGIYAVFWWLHFFDKYFQKINYYSDEDLLFMMYDSFGKVGGESDHRRKDKHRFNSRQKRFYIQYPESD